MGQREGWVANEEAKNETTRPDVGLQTEAQQPDHPTERLLERSRNHNTQTNEPQHKPKGSP